MIGASVAAVTSRTPAELTPRTPAVLLALAMAADPSRPLLTFYDDATDERTELSVATFANWVAKTANLLRDDLDLQPGARVEVDLPLHWAAAVWVQACWASGLVVVLAGGAPVDLAVVTHDRAHTVSDAVEVVSLGLGPLGLARAGHVPAYAGALDYDREVHGHGDSFTPVAAPRADEPAVTVGDRTLTGADLVAAAMTAPPLPAGGRLLLTEPLATPTALVGGLLVPLATQVTAVLCRHLDPSRLAHRIAQENLVAALAATAATAVTWTPLHRE